MHCRGENKMNKFKYVMLILLILTLPLAGSDDEGVKKSDFLTQNPHLNQFIYQKHHSQIYLGMGITPIAMTDNRFVFAGSLFQLHYITDNLDIELLNFIVATSQAEDSMFTSYHFMIRTAPKFRVYKALSIGGILGWEYVTFPEVNKKEYKDQYFTPLEPFSSHGPILGVILSQQFHYSKNYIIKLNQFLYRQFYSVEESTRGWKYWFEDVRIQEDPDKKEVSGGFVGGFEISILF